MITVRSRKIALPRAHLTRRPTGVAFAGLARESVLVGMGNRMEIWDPEKYDEHVIKDPEELSKLAEKYLNE